VSTGDSSGYAIAGTGTDFISGSRSFPVSALTVYNISTLTTGWHGPFTLTNSTPVTVASRNAPSDGSGDLWAFNDAVQVPASAGSGAYSTTLTYLAIAQ
jgi:hypothetical protein